VAKVISSKNRKQPKQMGDVRLMHGNAAEMGGFKHMRIGHELARPTLTADGTKVYQTPTGKQFVIKPMSS
jgi:hypothetical protein